MWTVSRDCPKLIECLPTLLRDMERNSEDVLKLDYSENHVGDDPADSARYGLQYMCRAPAVPTEVRAAKLVENVADPTMRVLQLKIENFRGIKSADLTFDGHTLLVGGNNVGKSTVCDALDLVLGPDRLGRFPPVEEFDFYNAEYLAEDGVTPKPLRIAVMLVDLSAEVERTCFAHTELWHLQ